MTGRNSRIRNPIKDHALVGYGPGTQNFPLLTPPGKSILPHVLFSAIEMLRDEPGILQGAEQLMEMGNAVVEGPALVHGAPAHALHAAGGILHDQAVFSQLHRIGCMWLLTAR